MGVKIHSRQPLNQCLILKVSKVTSIKALQLLNDALSLGRSHMLATIRVSAIKSMSR